MQFRYSAPGPDDTVDVGFVEADDEAAARDQLRARGIQPDLIEAVTDAPEDTPSETPAGASGLSSSEATETVGQIGRMIGVGIPLSAGLRALAEELPSAQMRVTFQTMSQELDEGRSLDHVVHSHAASLPAWLTGVVQAGAESGQLAESIEHYVRFARLRTRQIGQLIICLIYPAILLAVGTLLTGVMLTWITPEFREIFEGFGVELPEITRSLIQMSDFAVMLVSRWFATLVALAVAVGAPLLTFRLLIGADAIRRIINEIPIVGRMFRLLALSEFCHLLALYVENRIPLPKAFELVSCAVRDPHLKLAAAEASGHLNRGAPASRLDTFIPEFPTELMRLSGWESGEQELAESLHAASDLYRIQSDINSTAVGGFVGPIAVMFVASGVGLFVLAMFMPLIKLLNDLS